MSAVVGESGAAASAEHRRWIFGAVEFDERSFELRVAGEPVELEPKPLEVLLHLLRHAGEIVTKEELMAAVWPGRILTDNSLPKSISRIREVIGDDEQVVIKTVHGYGYRLVAPVTVQAAKAAPALTRLDLKAGDHPPLRPLWSLVEKLGGGGQGEVWLARHDKTREQRVFKFALDVAGLAAIKREITLYRFLRETLEGRDEFTRVLDWNLEEAPYYIELEHGAGGNLEDWAESMGGLGQVPLATRLDLVAQIAEALAAAHSVGVLHKDLKPSNVLVLCHPERSEGSLRIKLTDFGSGGVLDPQRLEALGITRLGFTQSIMQGEAAATAMYLAPEVMSGQPATVQGDIYSLGILLYQMVAGDLRRPLAPGWEQRVDEPLLREDIALAVAGDPARRLADASALATRLRTLDERRRQREAEQAEKLRLEQEQRAAEVRARKAELAVERLRTRRNWMRTVLAILIVGVSISLGLFLEARRARNEAAAAAASSQAVADFLSRDMFAQVGEKPLRDLTVAEMIESAAESLDRRTKELPEISAQLHAAIGNAAFAVERFELAERHLKSAMSDFEARQTGASPTYLTVAAQLLNIQKSRISELPALLPRYERLLADGRARLGERNPAVLELRQQIAKARFWAGDWKPAAEQLAALIEEQKIAGQPDRTIGAQQALLGRTLMLLGDYVTAEQVTAEALRRLQADPLSQAPAIADARLNLSDALARLERIPAAREQLALAEQLSRVWFGDAPNSAAMLSVRFSLALIEINAGRPNEGAALIEDIIRLVSTTEWNKAFDVTAVHRTLLVEAYDRAGRRDVALREARKALSVSLASFGEGNAITQTIRIQLADLLREKEPAEAQRVLADVDRGVIERLGPDALLAAEWHRVSGLFKLRHGAADEARVDLREALRVFTKCYGSRHRITQRASAELDLAGQT